MTTIVTTEAEQEAARRAALTQGLRDLADWLDANPHIPVGRYPRGSVDYCASTFADDGAGAAEVTTLRALDGFTTPESSIDDDGRVHYRAVRQFGPVEYRAFAIVMPEILEANA